MEDDLVEDYLEGKLSADDTQKFRERYARGPVEQRKLKSAQSLRHRAMDTSQQIPARTSAWEKLRRTLAGQPYHWRFAIVGLACLVIMLLIGGVWIGLRIQRTAHENSEPARVERQLADLNSTTNLHAQSPQMVSLSLAPIALRSVHSSAELTLPRSSQVIELHLLWTHKEEYPGYQGEFGRVGAGPAFKLPPLHLENNADGRLMRLRLPATVLEDGLYRITFRGLGRDGAVAMIEEYDFSIKRQ